jgi:hypothetical protein
MKTVTKIIDLNGGLAALEANPLALESPGYMKLCIEAIGPGPRGLPQVSIAHYGEQNGDAMRDPDMVFEIDAAGAWHPVSFRNDYVGLCNEAVWQEDAGRVLTIPSMIRELNSFARIWDTNIREQGFLEAARAVIAARVSK